MNRLEHFVILIVDDIADNLTIAKKVLQFNGAQVYTTSSGEECLELLKLIRPTVILLDIRMPKMDGWELFNLIRNNQTTANIPIIALTAYAMKGDKDEILKGGWDGYIAKPIDISTFIGEIERVVAKTLQNQ